MSKVLVHGPCAVDVRGFIRLQEGRQRGEHKEDQGNNGNGASSEGYDFTDGETQLMRICIDAMHTAGLAFIVQGISTMLLGEASAVVNTLNGDLTVPAVPAVNSFGRALLPSHTCSASVCAHAMQASPIF